MQYCINALLKNNNEIMQYYIINNNIALIMHYCALLQMPDYELVLIKYQDISTDFLFITSRCYR